MSEILLALVPLLALLASLLLGHYPGYWTIVRIAERIGTSLRPRGTKSHSRPGAPRMRAASGGLLIAFGIAQRPPPPAP
jgi:hypothetical protein